MAQQRIPEVKQICAKLILLAVSLNFFRDYNIKKKCIILSNPVFRNQGNGYLNDKTPKVNFLEYARIKNFSVWCKRNAGRRTFASW